MAPGAISMAPAAVSMVSGAFHTAPGSSLLHDAGSDLHGAHAHIWDRALPFGPGSPRSGPSFNVNRKFSINSKVFAMKTSL